MPLLFFAVPVRADCHLTGKQLRIMKIVMTVGGYINKDMHEQFWAEMRDLCDGDWIPWFLWIRKNLEMSQRYQLELWKSALASYQKNTVVKTKTLEERERRLEEHAATAPFPTAGEAQSYYIHQYRPAIELMKANTEELLQAAAAHTSMRTEQGYVIYFDREAVFQYILYGMNEGFKRGRCLFNPAWKEPADHSC